MQMHFVTFFSPGTFVSEMTERPIEKWDAAAAVEMAKSIHERYDARPYGFRFTTRSRGPQDLYSKVTATSNMFYLGGKVETLAEVIERNSPDESILRSNMRANGYDRIIVNTNSWRFTAGLGPDDVVLDVVFPQKAPSHD